MSCDSQDENSVVKENDYPFAHHVVVNQAISQMRSYQAMNFPIMMGRANITDAVMVLVDEIDRMRAEKNG